LYAHRLAYAAIREPRRKCAIESATSSSRVYFDLGTLLRQLGVARDPNSIGGKIEMVVGHPLAMGRALLRRRMRR
jgi:hypothetical protein